MAANIPAITDRIKWKIEQCEKDLAVYRFLQRLISEDHNIGISIAHKVISFDLAIKDLAVGEEKK